MKKIAIIAMTLFGINNQVMAQDDDSTSMCPSFHIDYISEFQTDFKRVRWGNMLQLSADIPITKAVCFYASSLSVATTDENPLANDLQGYSNIDAENMPFSLSVAGFTWSINDHHSIFAGIRRMDEDYFCCDALALFTNSSCGGFPTITANYDIAAYPKASMGLHYAYDNEKWGAKASLYNGAGYNRFTGRDNMFRICPSSDGVYALGQVEYHHKGTHYHLGASLHYSDLEGTASKRLRPTTWMYGEQALTSHIMLLAAYGHAFSNNHACRNFAGLGGKYLFGKTELGLFSDYTRVDDINEWATEITYDVPLTDYLSVRPVLHIINTDHCTKCIGMLRLNVCL